LAIAMGIGRFAFTPILPMMQADAGLSTAAAGVLASANYFGYLAGALSAIRLRMAPTFAVRLALLVIGVATLAMALALPLAAWIALRFVAGVASAWVLVLVSAWALAELARAGRAGLAGVVYAGVGVGILAAGLACLALVRAAASSAAAWTTLGLISLAATAGVWHVIRPPTPPPAVAQRTGGFTRLVLCYGAFGFGYIIPATFLPLMAKQAIADPGLFAWAWPVFGAAAAVSTLGVARSRVAPRRSWIAASLVMSAGVAAPLVVPGLPGVVLSALLVGGTFMVITMTGLQEARRVAGDAAGGLMAAMTSAFAVGQIAGPLVVSALHGVPHAAAWALGAASAALALSAVALLER
jgi:predicted MFS family arabinose efflux permease